MTETGVGRSNRPIKRLYDRQGGALVALVKMLNQDERHATVGGMALKND